VMDGGIGPFIEAYLRRKSNASQAAK